MADKVVPEVSPQVAKLMADYKGCREEIIAVLEKYDHVHVDSGCRMCDIYFDLKNHPDRIKKV